MFELSFYFLCFELSKIGQWQCGKCKVVKPNSTYPEHCQTSDNFAPSEWYSLFLTKQVTKRFESGVTQFTKGQTRTRSKGQQKRTMASLERKEDHEGYIEETV